MNRIDLTGQKFGRLTVLGIASYNKETKRVIWNCRCDCGKTIEVFAYNLRSGHGHSCGCLRNEKSAERKTTHGKRNTRLYRIWIGMRARCFNKNSIRYPSYGGRGITVCESWGNDFIAFETWALSNGYADNLSIDRIDVNGNYEPSNCRWADIFIQHNNKRNNCFITINGETHTYSEWERIRGLKPNTIHVRISSGWNPEEAVIGKRSKR